MAGAVETETGGGGGGMTPQQRFDRLENQIKRCAEHYSEPEKYPVEITRKAINRLMWRQFEIIESVRAA